MTGHMSFDQMKMLADQMRVHFAGVLAVELERGDHLGWSVNLSRFGGLVTVSCWDAWHIITVTPQAGARSTPSSAPVGPDGALQAMIEAVEEYHRALLDKAWVPGADKILEPLSELRQKQSLDLGQ